MKLIFRKKEDLDYFLSKKADHFWLGMYKVNRLNDNELELHDSFNNILTNNNKKENKKALFTKSEWYYDEKKMKKDIR